jgi:acyl-ACP thioesterase
VVQKVTGEEDNFIYLDRKVMELILRTESLVTSADADMEGRMKPGALVNLLIQSAIQSAEHLGFGFEMLKEQNLYWVLTRLHLEILRPLRWNEKAITKTWPKGIEGLLYLRDFLVKDGSDEIVARATSGWLAVDRTRKRPGKVVTQEPEKFYLLSTKHAVEALPGKLDGFQDGISRDLLPAYSDFDINRHVTTVRYIDWMMDCFPESFHARNYPVDIRVNFMKEILPGETIVLKYIIKDNSSHFEGTKKESGLTAYRGFIEFS